VLLNIIRLDFALKVRSVGTVADSLKDHHSRPPVTDTGSCDPAFVVKVGGRGRCTASSNSWLRALTERLIDEQVGWQCRSGWEDGWCWLGSRGSLWGISYQDAGRSQNWAPPALPPMQVMIVLPYTDDRQPINISISDPNTTDVGCALTPSFPFASRSVLPTRWSMNLADRHRLLVWPSSISRQCRSAYDDTPGNNIYLLWNTPLAPLYCMHTARTLRTVRHFWGALETQD